MKVAYNILSSNQDYNAYYKSQAGGNLPYFTGSTIQSGHGIGSMLAKVFKGTVLPMMKQGAKTVGKELLNTGLSVASDVISGKNFKSSAKRNLQNSGKTLLNNLTNSLINQKPSRKRKTNQRPHAQNKSKTSHRHNKKRKLGSDIFS